MTSYVRVLMVSLATGNRVQEVCCGCWRHETTRHVSWQYVTCHVASSIFRTLKATFVQSLIECNWIFIESQYNNIVQSQLSSCPARRHFRWRHSLPASWRTWWRFNKVLGTVFIFNHNLSRFLDKLSFYLWIRLYFPLPVAEDRERGIIWSCYKKFFLRYM